MNRRIVLAATALSAVIIWAPAQAQYRYGGYGGVEDQGFVLQIEGLYMNPRNADVVVATVEGLSQLRPLIPGWDDELAGRLGLGYKWASGNKLMFTVWGFSADSDATGSAATGQRLHFAIGPPIPWNGDYVGNLGDPGAFSATAEIEAGTADVMFGREHEISEGLRMEWGLGLRYVRYEETQEAIYSEIAGFDDPAVPMPARKTIQSDMLGAKVVARGTYRFSPHWSVGASLGFSFLDGEIDTVSRVSPQGTIGGSAVPYNEFVLVDDGRSGSITEFDVTFAWHNPSDRTRVYLGWEQQRWDDIAADAARNFPGTSAPLRPRNSVSFGGYKLGLRFIF